jgi:TDG/mug DNA glycosylase family protein
VDQATLAAYEAGATTWRARGSARFVERVQVLRPAVRAGAFTADLGCGAGFHLPHLPEPVVGLDVSAAMLALARDAAPRPPLVRAELSHLPFRRGSLGGGWARGSYLHLRRVELPWALMELHHATAVGAPVHLSMLRGDDEGGFADDPLPGRFFAQWQPVHLRRVVEGAGFDVREVVVVDGDDDRWMHLLATRARTLPDTVGPGMRLLLCGLNPSVYAADAGAGFARPGNRFWPAARAAGIATRDRDPRHALTAHGIGMTDLVKRATARADELSPAEYRAGADRVERLVEWLQPGAVCFVGLGGFRAARDRRAVAGVQPAPFGGVPAYVMPNPSGLNAHARPADLAEHLRAATRLADDSLRDRRQQLSRNQQ